jgi:hypothetical protein
MKTDNDSSYNTNPTQGHLKDGKNEGFCFLVVSLCIGANVTNNCIANTIFDEQCGKALKQKDFSYKFVCS